MIVVIPLLIISALLAAACVIDGFCTLKASGQKKAEENIREAIAELRKRLMKGESMKYIIELEKIEGTDLYKAKGTNTLVFDEFGIKNILTPLEEREVDWANVQVDTPILVSDDDINWFERHFCKVEDGKVYAWADGTTSFSCVSEHNYNKWEYAKLAEVDK